MSIRSAPDIPVQALGKKMLFNQLGDHYVRVHFLVVDNLAVPLHLRTSFIVIFVNRVFAIERRIFPIRSHAVTTLPEYTPTLDLLPALESDSYLEINTKDQKTSSSRTPLFGITKCVAILLNTEAPVQVLTNYDGLVYMPLHTNLMRY